MARNRVIYNLQDLFFGLPSGTYDNLNESQIVVRTDSPDPTKIVVSTPALSSGDYGDLISSDNLNSASGKFQILRRIDRVQSFDYSFNLPREEVGILGKSVSIERPILAPPEINLNFSYLLRGIQNEKRIGLNVAAQDSTQIPLLIQDFLDPSRMKDRRNIYLLINNQNEFDIREYEKNETLESGFLYSESYLTLIDSGLGEDYVTSLSGASFLIENNKAKNFGMLTFQNAYLQKLSLEASVGSLAKVDVSYVADNVIYKTGAGRGLIPCLDTSNGSISYDQNYYLIPKTWKEEGLDPYWNQTFGPGDIQVEIIREDNPKKDRTILDYGFETSDLNSPIGSYGVPDGHATFAITGESYIGQSGLAIINNSSFFGVSFGGVYLPLLPQVKGRKYTISFWAKSYVGNGGITVSFQNEDSASNNLSFSTQITSEWSFFSNTQYINAEKNSLYIWGTTANHTFVIDGLLVYEELDDITFHKEPLQSFSFNLDIPRENISYLGQKLYEDRQPKFPANVEVSLSTLAQENSLTSGSFLNNLALDANYSFKVKFYDPKRNLILSYDFNNSKLDSVNYSLDIGSNKSSTLNFSMQMDTDDKAQGVFVSGNFPELSAFFVDQSGNLVKDEFDNNISYNFLYKF